MTKEEIVRNEEARKVLKPGKFYKFHPPVSATSIPARNEGYSKERMATFDRGLYLGFRDGVHVFSGKPLGPKKPPECFFHVFFTGGSFAILDYDQG